MFKTTKTSIITLTMATALTGMVEAQLVSERSAYRVSTFGTSSANLQPFVSGKIRREDMRYRATPSSTPSGAIRNRYDADGRLIVHTHVFGRKFTAFSLSGDASVVEGYLGQTRSNYVSGTPRGSSVRAHGRLRMAGYTLPEPTIYGSGQIARFNYNANVIDISSTFYPGGVPVTVHVGAGGSVNTRLDATLQVAPSNSSRMAGNSRVGLTGSGSGYIRGFASAAVGWDGFGAGVEFELRLLNTTITMSVTGSPSNIYGNVNLRIQPITIYLKAFAECGKRWSTTIYSVSLGSAFYWGKTYQIV